MTRLLLLFGAFALTGPLSADTDDRPFVKGGVDDKPFITKVNRASFGGYTEAHFRYERTEGITEELMFENKRFNLFTHAAVSERVQVAAEIEFEEGGEEIKIELAMIDFEIHPALTLRGGILLSPLGRFNLAHDSPTNDLTDRPLVSTQLIPTALSEAGMGFYGAFFPSADTRLTYEAYLVNGFHDGVILDDADGTRIAGGKGNFEDNNNRPAFVGRLGLSPRPATEIGLSIHTGPYNTWMAEDLRVDERRSLTIWALDWEYSWKALEFLGEYAAASVDVPQVSGLFAESQQGFYAQFNAHFGRGLFADLPQSHFTGIARLGAVDFDTDTEGDSQTRLTLGLNFRPLEDTVFKLDYQRDWAYDAFNNKEQAAAILFSLATYF